MSEGVTLVALSQMVDLSINCKEGVINFQILHALLHVMIQQLSLKDVGVEFRGPSSDRVQALISSTPVTTNLYPDYSIVGSKGKKRSSLSKRPISLQDVIKEKETAEEKRERELRVIDRRKDSKEDPDPSPLPLKSPQESMLGMTPTDVQTVVLIDSQSTLPQFTVAVRKSIFDNIQTDIGGIRKEIQQLKELPGNFGLIESTRNGSGPIQDMFQVLNLTKRMDAIEMSIQKMGTLVEDVAKHDLTDVIREKLQDVKLDASLTLAETGEIQTDSSIPASFEARITGLEKNVRQIMERGAGFVPADKADQVPSAEETVSVGRSETKDQSKKIDEKVERKVEEKSDGKVAGKTEASKKTDASFVEDVEEDTASVSVTGSRRSTMKSDVMKVFSPQTTYNSLIQKLDLTEFTPHDAVAKVQEEFNNLSKWIAESLIEVEKAKVLETTDGGGEISSSLLDSKLKQYAQQLANMDNTYNNQIGLLSEKFVSVERDITDIITKLEVVLPGGDSTGIGEETTLDLAGKLALLEKEIVAISQQAAKLEEEKLEHTKQTTAILEQLDVLKIVKANREDLEDALGEKADACMINRKVSHDQFDAACDDLSRGIEEALNKLEEQEEMWQQALEAIQKEVGNKLDKMEVDPLRDFVNSKLKALQEKFKSLTALKKEQEAAGTKSKFLRNVNCISCDKDVVMRKEMDSSLKPKAYAMPPTRNMAPYLAYELDQLRKQQKCVPGSKNLNFIETALKTRGQRDKDHICNRYCGGSHTVTTPQQRVTRLGHFLEQWGPEIAPLQDEYIKGVDNHMYRGREESYKKTSTHNNKGGPAGKNGVQSSEKPQQDRNMYVDSFAQEAIGNEEQSKSMSTRGSSRIRHREIAVRRGMRLSNRKQNELTTLDLLD